MKYKLKIETEWPDSQETRWINLHRFIRLEPYTKGT